MFPYYSNLSTLLVLHLTMLAFEEDVPGSFPGSSNLRTKVFYLLYDHKVRVVIQHLKKLF